MLGINGNELFLGLEENKSVVLKGALDMPVDIDDSYSFYKGEIFKNALGTFVLHFKKKYAETGQNEGFKTLIINGDIDSFNKTQFYIIEDIIESEQFPEIQFLERKDLGYLNLVYNSELSTYSPNGYHVITYPFNSNEDPTSFMRGKPIIINTVNLSGDMYDKPILADAVNANIISIELQSPTKEKLWLKDYTVSDWILKEGESRYNSVFLSDIHSYIRIDTRESGMKYYEGSLILQPYKKNTSIYINKVSGSIFQTKEF
ncbi:hypothetical protein [Sphingobacterium bovisgrunnientis]|uniref:hypothetical protein n=1 Tax=Sphingobacterium bovisgrunnientis TaxID=1874697 RepID=UPI00135AB3EB|nr:hypothetical protein [Sphingobacterium bovisgrunnientis]